MTEESIAKAITYNANCAANSLDFMLWGAFSQPFAETDGLFISYSVPREELGLFKGGVPGDIDILAIPFKDNEPLSAYAMAIEVKVTRPTLAKPSKNANKLGSTQTLGLVAAGFPLVGLLHVCMPEKTPSDLLTPIPFLTEPYISSGNQKDCMLMDLFPVAVAERQQGRLTSLNLPSWIGIHAFGISSNKEGEMTGCTVGYSRKGSINPGFSSLTVGLSENFLKRKTAEIHRMFWYHKDALA
jgi:hypothetical protein